MGEMQVFILVEDLLACRDTVCQEHLQMRLNAIALWYVSRTCTVTALY